MSSQDMKNNILQKVALNTQVIASDTTTAGVIIDTQGFEALTFLMQVGVVTAGDVTMLIEESDDAAFATSNEVIDSELLGTEADTTLDTSQTISRIGYIGCKRFVRLSAVTDNSADLTVGAAAILGHPRKAETAAA